MKYSLLIFGVLVFCIMISPTQSTVSTVRCVNDEARRRLQTVAEYQAASDSRNQKFFALSSGNLIDLKRTESPAVFSQGIDILRFCAISCLRGRSALAIAGLLVLQNTAPMALIMLTMGQSSLFFSRRLAERGLAGASRYMLGEAAYWASRNGLFAAVKSVIGGSGLASQEMVFGGSMAGALILFNSPAPTKRTSDAKAATLSESKIDERESSATSAVGISKGPVQSSETSYHRRIFPRRRGA